jgi:hypothetical protein
LVGKLGEPVVRRAMRRRPIHHDSAQKKTADAQCRQADSRPKSPRPKFFKATKLLFDETGDLFTSAIGDRDATLRTA